MYAQGGGSNPSAGILGGLTKKSGAAGAYGKGLGMAAAAGLNMDREKKNQEFGLQQMKDESQLRQQGNQNMAQRAGNESEARMQRGAIGSRQNVFNNSMNYDYAALQKRQDMQLRQALLNNVARDF
jgi:hypothetical protein